MKKNIFNEIDIEVVDAIKNHPLIEQIIDFIRFNGHLSEYSINDFIENDVKIYNRVNPANKAQYLYIYKDNEEKFRVVKRDMIILKDTNNTFFKKAIRPYSMHDIIDASRLIEFKGRYGFLINFTNQQMFIIFDHDFSNVYSYRANYIHLNKENGNIYILQEMNEEISNIIQTMDERLLWDEASANLCIQRQGKANYYIHAGKLNSARFRTVEIVRADKLDVKKVNNFMLDIITGRSIYPYYIEIIGASNHDGVWTIETNRHTVRTNIDFCNLKQGNLWYEREAKKI